ncbi:MAG: metal ABC transporter permease [Chloroflexi bacterium]|nr:metal ABC transporter permease [Chloroflexota bacterium]
MESLLEPLQYGFVQRAMAGALLVALVCASVGVFVVLRGLAFLGDAVAHAAFPGVVGAFLLRLDLTIGGAVASVSSALAIGLLARRAGLREDTAIGVVFAGMFALGVVMFSAIKSYTGDLLGVLLGDVLGITDQQLLVAAVLTAVIAVLLTLTWKELVFVSFDPTGAEAAGLPVLRYDALLLGLIGLAIAVSIQLVGVVLVVAMLVTPAATARLLARDMRSLLVIALAVAALSGMLGIELSYFLNTASGGTIVLVATVCFALAAFARALRARGLNMSA